MVLTVHTAFSASAPFPSNDTQKLTPQVGISLLNEVRIWLEARDTRIEIPIKSYRRQELLAYLATQAPTREQRISSGRILTDVFEHNAPRADVDNLRTLFQKHTQLLRKEINTVAKEAGWSQVRLFCHEKVDNSATKWWLAPECHVVDLTAIKKLHEQMQKARDQGEASNTVLKEAGEQLMQIYQSGRGDYLERHLLQQEFGDAEWVRAPFTEYRDMYLQALWDVAILEHRECLQPEISEQERLRKARRAAALYRQYALHAPKHRDLDMNARKSWRQSERALRGFLRLCQWMQNAQGADEGYSLYELLMKEEYPEWKPNIKTVELLKAVRQLTGQQPLRLDMLEMPKLS